MENKKIKVLYIAGSGRSGTTILENILGQAKDFFPIGEFRYIWVKGFIENRLCGCGEPFRECKIWEEIIEKAYGSFDGVNPIVMDRMVHDETRTMRIPWLFMAKGGNLDSPQRREYVEKIRAFYLAVKQYSGAKVIVDSSKLPVPAALLRLIPEFDLYLVHVMRDPRAVAFSWSQPKPDPSEGGKFMLSIGPWKSSMLWNSWNLATEYLGRLMPERYLRFSYEEFAVHPRRTIESIFELLNEDAMNLPFLDDHTVYLEPMHTVSGNPSRFKTGRIVVELDQRWKTAMKPRMKFLVTLLTLPLLQHYGYDIRAKINHMEPGDEID